MKIKTTHLFLLSITFVVFTVVGTLSHEYGHIAVARSLGYHTTLHYASMNWYKSAVVKDIDDQLKIGKRLVDVDHTKPKNHVLWVAMGGPAQTMLTGLLGLFLLSKRRKTKRHRAFGFIDWFLVFLTLFWLRQVFNVIMIVAKGYLNNKPNYFVGNGDEIRISNMLGLPSYSIAVALGVIGFIICTQVVFKYVLKKDQPTFLLSGIIGGGLGYFLWMELIGPIVLP